MTDRCRSCDAPIRWARTEARDLPMPLNPEPTEEGNVQLVNGKARVLAGFDLLHAGDAGEPLYRAHFATCPNATEHRKAS